ncbi:caffeoylshikimate esterase [Spatholobus suberectus]|nr:caffeoylshikimate esterase [Spatholobus suberectus]
MEEQQKLLQSYPHYWVFTSKEDSYDLSFFNFVKQNPQFRGLPCFLYGKSMGDAVLVSPMCKMSNKVRSRRLFCNMNSLRYWGRPRLGTVVELLRVTDLLN